MRDKIFKAIFLNALIIFIIFILITSRNILKPVFISLIIAYIFYPVVKIMMKNKMSKSLASLICIFTVLIAIAGILLYIVPAIYKDLSGISGNIESSGSGVINYIRASKIYKISPDYIKNIVDGNSTKIESGAEILIHRAEKGLLDAASKVPSYILTPIFIYYFIVDSDYFINIIKRMIPLKYRNSWVKLGREIDGVIGNYMRGQIILSILIAVLTFAVLIILKVKYPLVISIINGIVNIIPYFGPLIGMIPAFICAMTQSLEKAVLVVILLFAIQEYESNIVAPKIIGDSVGIHPVFVILILLLGGKYFGWWGLVLSVPAAGIIKTTFRYGVNKLF